MSPKSPLQTLESTYCPPRLPRPQYESTASWRVAETHPDGMRTIIVRDGTTAHVEWKTRAVDAEIEALIAKLNKRLTQDHDRATIHRLVTGAS